MFGVDDLVEGFVAGTVLGAGMAAGAAVAVVGSRRGRPLVKRAIKGYIAATQRAREAAAEAGEQLQDLYAEAKHEYESQLSSPSEPEPAAPARRRGQAAPAQATPAEQPA